MCKYFINPDSYLVDEAFHFVLQAKPLKLDSDKFIGTHVRTVGLLRKLFLYLDWTQVKKMLAWMQNCGCDI